MMNGKAQISGPQLAAVVMIFTHFAPLLYLPGQLTRIADRDAWLALSLGALLGLLPAGLMLALLARYHPRRSFGQICVACFGRWFGKLAIGITGAFSLLHAALATRNIIEFLAIQFPDTPTLVVSGLFGALAIYAGYNGAEVMARMAFLVAGVGIPLTVLIELLGLAKEFDLLRLQPILYHGLTPVLRAAWPAIGWFTEIWLCAPLVGYLNNPRRTGRALLLGGAIGSATLTVKVIIMLLMFGAGFSKKFMLSNFSLVTMVRLGEFLERVEPFFNMHWAAAMVLKMAICIWTASVCFAEVVGLPHDRPVLLPVGAATVWLSFIWPSLMAFAVWLTIYWTPLTLVVSLSILVPLVLISWWRARRKPARQTAL